MKNQPAPSQLNSAVPALLVALFLPSFPPSTVGAQSTGSIAGIVVFAGGGPAADAEVRIPSLGRRTAVDSAGAFFFASVPAGSHILEATSPRWGRGITRVEVVAGGIVTITIELDPLFRLDELVVSASPLSSRRSDLYQPASALAGLALGKAARSSLGETLAGEPGVSSTYFGPGSSRPLIRGLGGDRVRILDNGVGSGDVSNLGPDHAVALEPVSAERIEILRGPATLLYGGSAVGGVVNVFDERIPQTLPQGPLSGSFTGVGGSAARERTGALSLTGALGGRWGWSLRGLRRATEDVRIPGNAAHEHENGEGGHEAEGVLPNSAVETGRASFGLSWFGQDRFLGVSLDGLQTVYGIPSHGHGDTHRSLAADGEESGVTIRLNQRRADLEGAWRFMEGRVHSLDLRLGAADYDHKEMEGGEVGTHFSNRSLEGRLEVTHRLLPSVAGAMGVQALARDFSARGEEVFVPPARVSSLAAFLYQEFEAGPLRLQAGARLDGQKAKQETGDIDRDHGGFSLSGGATWRLPRGGVSVAVSLGRSVKLPAAEELFSQGPHAATFAYEVGDPFLREEVAYTLDATLRRTEGRFRGELTLFRSFFDGFIYQAPTGDSKEGFPVLRYAQSDALFGGFEGAVELSLIHQGRHHLLWEWQGDYVRGRLSDLGEDLPRIPPLRIGTRLRYDGGTLRGDFGAVWVARQERVAPFEEPTEGYTLLEASLGYRFFRGRLVHDLILQGTNLTNREARLHTSFLKELAPLPGRDLRILYRLYF